MAKSRKPAHPQWGCIWCGKIPRTGEHLWPEWFSKIVPQTRNSHSNLKTRISYKPQEVVVSHQLKKRPGDPASRRIKAVCKDCNNVWMGKIEEAAIPVMTPLILGKEALLSPADQKAIVEWAVLKTMIGEYDDSLDTRAINEETQQAFYHDRSLIGVWKILIGRYVGTNWVTRYRHTPYHMRSRSNFLPVVDVTSMNTQVSTFVGGQLYIHVMSTRLPQLASFGFRGTTGNMLRCIWPATDEPIPWPPALTMGDDDAEFVASALAGLNQPRAPYL